MAHPLLKVGKKKWSSLPKTTWEYQINPDEFSHGPVTFTSDEISRHVLCLLYQTTAAFDWKKFRAWTLECLANNPNAANDLAKQIQDGLWPAIPSIGRTRNNYFSLDKCLPDSWRDFQKADVLELEARPITRNDIEAFLRIEHPQISQRKFNKLVSWTISEIRKCAFPDTRSPKERYQDIQFAYQSYKLSQLKDIRSIDTPLQQDNAPDSSSAEIIQFTHKRVPSALSPGYDNSGSSNIVSFPSKQEIPRGIEGSDVLEFLKNMLPNMTEMEHKQIQIQMNDYINNKISDPYERVEILKQAYKNFIQDYELMKNIRENVENFMNQYFEERDWEKLLQMNSNARDIFQETCVVEIFTHFRNWASQEEQNNMTIIIASYMRHVTALRRRQMILASNITLS